MAVHFWDTSAIVKRYVQETGTAWVQSLTDPAVLHSHFLIRITFVEIMSAVTRKEKSRTITPAHAAKALADFQLDFDRQYLITDVSASLVGRAGQLAQRQALRGYDAVQLAGALTIRVIEPSLILVSADADLNTAATAEGLPVENPNNHP